MDSLLTLTSGTDVLLGNDQSFAIAFHIGSAPVRWYAIMSLAGYITAICVYMLSIWKRYKISVDVGFYYIFIAIPMILLGARLWSGIIGDLQWSDFFKFQTGGLAIQGGVIFGVLSALIYFPIILHFPKYHKRVVENGHVYIQRPSMWLYADAIVPTILLGQAIGRWGNFFNGELFGKPISPEDLSWLKAIMPGVYNHMQAMPGSQIPLGNGTYAPVGTYFEPLFLYESFLNIISFTVIYGLLAEIKKIRAGVITGLYFISYGVVRYGMESQRNHEFAFTGTYILNGILLGVGLIIVIYCQFYAYKLRKYYLWVLFKSYIHYLYKDHKFKAKVRLMKKNNERNAVINDYIKQNEPNLKNFGYAHNINYIRHDSDLTYFAGR